MRFEISTPDIFCRELFCIANIDSEEVGEMRKLVTSLITMAVSLALTSCVANNTLIIPAATLGADLKDTSSGVILVQIADTTPVGAIFPANHITLAPIDVNESDESKYLKLAAAEAEGDSTQLFYSVVPANEYSISSISSLYSLRDGYFTQLYPANLELGTFVIEPGKVTDLGVLAVYVRRSGDDYNWKTIRAPTGGRAAKALQSSVPHLSSKIENLSNPLTWKPDGNDRDRGSDYVNAVNRQTVFSEPYIDEQTGVMKFPSRLGVMAVRDLNGEWRIDAIPADVEITRITMVDKTDVVLTEFNEIFARSSLDDEWENIEPPPGTGKLTFIGNHATAGFYAVRATPSSVTVWARSSLDGEWSVLAKVRPDHGFIEAFGESFRNIDRDLRLSGYAVHGDSLYLPFNRRAYRVDLQRRVVIELDVPRTDSIQIRNGIITTDAYQMRSAARVSFDHGDTWQRWSGNFFDKRSESAYMQSKRRAERGMASAKLIGHPVFRDSDLGFAIHDGRKRDESAFMVTSEDGGKTWNAGSEAELPENCDRLLQANQTELLLGCSLSGEIYKSTDFGMSWKLDREVSDT